MLKKSGKVGMKILLYLLLTSHLAKIPEAEDLLRVAKRIEEGCTVLFVKAKREDIFFFYKICSQISGKHKNYYAILFLMFNER